MKVHLIYVVVLVYYSFDYCIVCDTHFDAITLEGLHICLNMFSLLQ